jgi:hypothetical protein
MKQRTGLSDTTPEAERLLIELARAMPCIDVARQAGRSYHRQRPQCDPYRRSPIMRSDIAPGGAFPDYELPDHTGTLRRLSELQGDDPLILTLARGHYCPKEHQQHLELAAFYPKIAVAYTQIATISTDDHHSSQEFRASSSFTGPFNFSAGANYLHYETEENYYVFINSLTLATAQGLGGNAPQSLQAVWMPGTSEGEVFRLSIFIFLRENMMAIRFNKPI